MAVVRSPHFTATRSISWCNYVNIRSCLLYCLLLPIVRHVAIMLVAEALARFPRTSLYLLLTFAFIYAACTLRTPLLLSNLFHLFGFRVCVLASRGSILNRVLRASRLFVSRVLRDKCTEWRLCHGVNAEILICVVVGIWEHDPRIAEYGRRIREAFHRKQANALDWFAICNV